MTLKDRKFIPYYIIAAVIVAASIVIVTVVSATIINKTPEEVAPEETTLFMNGEVPYYPEIPAATYNEENFTMEDGRITYEDAAVNHSTGIDVSAFQGDIDWEAVAQDNIDFAIIRIGYRGYGSEGIIREDENARKNIVEASAAGLNVGVYFYSQAITQEEAVEEAEFVLNIIKDYNIDGPVVYDWENEPGVGMRTDNLDGSIITQCAVGFCERIKSEGYTPAVYFNLTDAYVRYDLDKISDYIFWYAQHEGEIPAFYYNYNIWQYSDSGKVNGIDGNVDMNISFIDFSQFA